MFSLNFKHIQSIGANEPSTVEERFVHNNCFPIVFCPCTKDAARNPLRCLQTSEPTGAYWSLRTGEDLGWSGLTHFCLRLSTSRLYKYNWSLNALVAFPNELIAMTAFVTSLILFYG